MARRNRPAGTGVVVGRLIILVYAILFVGAILAQAGPATSGAPAASRSEADGPRRRVRDLGIAIGRMAPGPLNAITDVKGVRVGHVTLVRGDGMLRPGKGPVRTGVTAILPHGGDLWREKVPAATWVLNGTGEMTGSIWIDTQGALEVPILMTNTMNVGRVMDGVVAYMLKRYPDVRCACPCLSLIRSGGHLPKGGYDVQNGITQSGETRAATVHGGVHGRGRPAGLG